MRRGLAFAACLCITGALPACANQGSGATVTVLAAASLTRPFTELAEGYEAEHPGVSVVLSFGPSDGLAGQIQQGAPADVFASASPRWMDAVARDPGVTDRRPLATNTMVILVPAGNPRNIHGLADLADPGVALVLGAQGVPVGDYARQVLAAAGVDVSASLVSNEQDSTALSGKVALGEADAAIAYATDAVTGTEAIPIPERDNVVATYEVGVPASAPHPPAAAGFVSYLTGPAGVAALSGAGFEA